jgi:hypothetical protein
MLPNVENAYIPPEKLTGYLLSETHAAGKSKARFFKAHGYDGDNPHRLEQDLLSVPRYNGIDEQIASPHGTKYVVRGVLGTPRGTTVTVNTIWIMESSDERPRFVTAYPG